jgi:hypothetical protein
MDYSVCCIKGCDKEVEALGLCVNHWRLNRRYGSPVATKMHSGSFQGKSADERFAMQVRKQASGCLHWVGATDQDGYGAFKGEAAGKMYYRAHRWSWAFHNDQPIPPYGHICHTCDNPRCVNPDHLVLGTALSNMQDKIAKGRARVGEGEKHGSAVLTEDQARAILSDPRTYTELAAAYNVKPSTIGSLKQRYSWRSLGDVEVVKAPRVSPRKGVSDRLNPDIVREIRTKQLSGKEYAKKFGVSVATVCDIQKRRSWAHVE